MWLKIPQLLFHATFFSLFLIFSFFVGLVLTPFYLYRLCIAWLAKIIRSTNTVEIVNLLESTLAEDDITCCPKSAICGIIVLNATASLEEIRNTFETKLVRVQRLDSKSDKNCLSYPRFQQYPDKWLGYNFWNWDTEFSIDKHIRPYQKANKFITENELIAEIGSLRMFPFRKKAPVWEILYVDNYLSKSDILNNNVENPLDNEFSCEPKTALIFRVHHMMADGYSLMTAFMKDLCGQNMESLNRVTKKEDKSKIQIAWELANYLLRIPYLLLRQYLVDIDFHIWCTWESILTHQMLSNWTDKIPIEIVKEISKKHAVSFTSVLLAGIAGGINKFFAQNNMERNIPRVMRAIAAAPVNGHPFDRLCNHWTFAVIPLPTGTSTPDGRLQNVNKAMIELKGLPTPLMNYYLMSVVGVLPSWIIKIFSQAFFGTSVMSNFPGPPNQIKFGQQFPIQDMAFWPIFYRGRAGLGFTMLSYMDGVRICITIDKAHINTQRGVEELTKYIQQEFAIMNNSNNKAILKAE